LDLTSCIVVIEQVLKLFQTKMLCKKDSV